MPLISCKVELSLKWYETCLLTVATTATFEITDAKLYVPIVTLSIEDNSKLTKLLSEGFKRSIYWNEYKVTPNKIIEIAANNDIKYIRELLDSSCLVLIDYLFLLMIIQVVIIKFLLSHIKKCLKMFNGNNLPHELLLKTRQKTKVRNAFNNNRSTD